MPLVTLASYFPAEVSSGTSLGGEIEAETEVGGPPAAVEDEISDLEDMIGWTTGGTVVYRIL